MARDATSGISIASRSDCSSAEGAALTGFDDCCGFALAGRADLLLPSEAAQAPQPPLPLLPAAAPSPSSAKAASLPARCPKALLGLMPLCFFRCADDVSTLGSVSHTPFGPKASSSVVPLRIVSLASAAAFLSSGPGVVEPGLLLLHRSVSLILVERRSLPLPPLLLRASSARSGNERSRKSSYVCETCRQPSQTTMLASLPPQRTSTREVQGCCSSPAVGVSSPLPPVGKDRFHCVVAAESRSSEDTELAPLSVPVEAEYVSDLGPRGLGLTFLMKSISSIRMASSKRRSSSCASCCS